MNANQPPSGEYAAVSALSTPTPEATAMSVAADGGGVTPGTIDAVGDALTVGLGLVAGVDGVAVVGELDGELGGVGEPEPAEGLETPLVGGADVVAGLDGRAGVGVAVAAGLPLGVGAGPDPVLMTYIERPVEPDPWPKTIICPDVGDWWTLLGLTDRVTTLLAFRSIGAQPDVASAGHTSLTGAWRTTIEPSLFVLTQATSAGATLIGVGSRIAVAVGSWAIPGERAGEPRSWLPMRKPTTITAAIDPRTPIGAHGLRGKPKTDDPPRRTSRPAGRALRPAPDRPASASSAADVRAHRSRGGGTTRIARSSSRSAW